MSLAPGEDYDSSSRVSVNLPGLFLNTGRVHIRKSCRGKVPVHFISAVAEILLSAEHLFLVTMSSCAYLDTV